MERTKTAPPDASCEYCTDTPCRLHSHQPIAGSFVLVYGLYCAVMYFVVDARTSGYTPKGLLLELGFSMSLIGLGGTFVFHNGTWPNRLMSTIMCTGVLALLIYCLLSLLGIG